MQHTVAYKNIAAAQEALALADSYFKAAGKELLPLWNPDSAQWSKVLRQHGITRPLASHSLKLAEGHTQSFEDIERIRLKAIGTARHFHKKAVEQNKGVPKLVRALNAYDDLNENQQRLFATQYTTRQRPARKVRAKAKATAAQFAA